MSSMNRVMLLGRLTRDPVLRQLGERSEVAEFGLAVSERYTPKGGETKETVCFVEIVAWNRQAELSSEYLRKGSQVLIEGKLQLNEWTDKQSGEKRSKLKVRAEMIHFLGAPRGERVEEELPAEADAPGAPPQERPPERSQERPARGRPVARVAA